MQYNVKANAQSQFNIDLLRLSEDMDRLVHRIASSTSPENALQYLWALEDKCEEASMIFDKYKGAV